MGSQAERIAGAKRAVWASRSHDDRPTWALLRYGRGVQTTLLLVAALVLLVLVPGLIIWRILASRRHIRASDFATFATLHTAAQAAPALRAGLTPAAAANAVKPLRTLLGSSAIAIADTERLLAWSGSGDHHGDEVIDEARSVLLSGRLEVVDDIHERCGRDDCTITSAVLAPLVVDEHVVGVLGAYSGDVTPTLVRTTDEVAQWVSSQLELADLTEARARLAEAQLKALRAQISPHFIYNALTAIASYVRTDPENARELLLDFADFARYSLRRHGQFTTLSEELRSINRYLALEQARFGDRMRIVVRIAPEVLPVVVPFLCLQPIVENAVQHGIEQKPGSGTISVIAEDAGSECIVRVEDDGPGNDPETIRAILAGEHNTDSIGIANVDERLRSTFGDAYGLVIETGLGAGTAVTLRFPKFHPGVTV